VGSPRHLIALRQVASLDRPDAGSSVPFFLQATLGGSKMLRGYSSFRFRDDKLLALAGEYRFELRPSLELALIGEAAKVFPTMSDFDLRRLRHSWGLGIRIKSPHQVHLRVDVLHSAETTRFDLKLGPSF
jgi:outer membrane protein assembly factor BamA